MRRLALGFTLAALTAAGCGSEHSSKTASTSGAPDGNGLATRTATLPLQKSTPSGGARPVGPGHGAPSPGSTAGSDVRVPATFTIGAHDTFTPPSVAAPSSTPIALTVISRDGKAHDIVVRSAPARSLRVPAGGRASLLLTGLRDGTYTVTADGGAGEAALVVGAEPGP